MSYPLHVRLFSSIIRNQSSICLRGYLDLKLNSNIRYYRHSSSKAKPLICLLLSCKSDTWLAKMWGSIQTLEKKTKEEPTHDSHSSISKAVNFRVMCRMKIPRGIHDTSNLSSSGARKSVKTSSHYCIIFIF